MYQLTIGGKPLGKMYGSEEDVWAAYLRMRPCFLGLWWKKVETCIA